MTTFADGLIVKKPHQNAPDFVKARVSIKKDEFLKWLEPQQKEWINLDLKESKGGKLYFAVDNWQPNNEYDQNDNQSQHP